MLVTLMDFTSSMCYGYIFLSVTTAITTAPTHQQFPLTSSRLMNSLDWQSPGIRPFFLIQNIEANEPEKKIPSTAANATTLSP